MLSVLVGVLAWFNIYIRLVISLPCVDGKVVFRLQAFLSAHEADVAPPDGQIQLVLEHLLKA